ncbi:hypothetical protein CVT26_000671 [Gymnopilus dilepis]|uniref:Uncharacterized protein n=1 Tax=Gymnopilus dilepis TaxID=231916 RepID=A0A409WL58_9AGAR|nr:hypothetical protein CVT26_000671 [Gymnopilus dilepis]
MEDRAKSKACRGKKGEMNFEKAFCRKENAQQARNSLIEPHAPSEPRVRHFHDRKDDNSEPASWMTKTKAFGPRREQELHSKRAASGGLSVAQAVPIAVSLVFDHLQRLQINTP